MLFLIIVQTMTIYSGEVTNMRKAVTIAMAVIVAETFAMTLFASFPL